jgi:hypothetical protein
MKTRPGTRTGQAAPAFEPEPKSHDGLTLRPPRNIAVGFDHAVLLTEIIAYFASKESFAGDCRNRRRWSDPHGFVLIRFLSGDGAKDHLVTGSESRILNSAIITPGDDDFGCDHATGEDREHGRAGLGEAVRRAFVRSSALVSSSIES